MRIGMIGGKTSTAGFGALGLETFPVDRPREAPEIWSGVEPEKFAIIFVTEPIYQVLKEEIDDLKGGELPVVIVVPAVAGSMGLADRELRRLVEKAVGTDIVFRE